jgi:TetR/AcrR family fatty acid metabolism transcriptional regulator
LRKIERGTVQTAAEGERRKTILRAAISVFAEKGYHGCRISDVAREAKVAYGLVYHYFQDKQALLQSVFEVGWGGFVTRVREAAEGSGTIQEKVERILDVAFDAYRVDPQAVKVILLEIARNPTVGRVNRQSQFRDVIEVGGRMFAEAQRKGELKSGADPMLYGAFLFGAIELGLTAFVLGLVQGDSEEALAHAKRQLADSFLGGVSAPRQPGLALTSSA